MKKNLIYLLEIFKKTNIIDYRIFKKYILVKTDLITYNNENICIKIYFNRFTLKKVSCVVLSNAEFKMYGNKIIYSKETHKITKQDLVE